MLDGFGVEVGVGANNFFGFGGNRFFGDVLLGFGRLLFGRRFFRWAGFGGGFRRGCFGGCFFGRRFLRWRVFLGGHVAGSPWVWGSWSSVVAVDVYPDTYSKVALALTSAQVAKESLVAEFGAGEDLPFNFFGWNGGDPVLLVQLARERMVDPIDGRLELCAGAVQVMRTRFGCDSLTLVAEGFFSSHPEITRSMNMRLAFDNDVHYVKECITVAHVELDDSGGPLATLVTCPYQYLGDKVVVWDELRAFSRGVGQVLRDVPFPAMMAAALRLGVEVWDDEESVRVLDVLSARGFNVQQFF